MDEVPAPTLYQELLGDDFARLPAILQSFHGSHQPMVASGAFTVTAGTSRLQRMAARLLRLPLPGENIATHLTVTPGPGREIWRRSFNGRRLITVQWRDGVYLVERAGLLKIVVRVEADENGIYHRFHHCELGGVRLPARASLQVDGSTVATDGGWHVEVVISTPLLGVLTIYRGEVKPLP